MIRRIVVLSGGCSSEREVSLWSGTAVHIALSKLPIESDLIVLDQESLPDELDPVYDVIFPVLHGGFGEDGRLQKMLEAEGFKYPGSDSIASRLCMMKPVMKQMAEASGVPGPASCLVTLPGAIDVDKAVSILGEDIVAKPSADGSSVGLSFLKGRDALQKWVDTAGKGEWLLETRIEGRELTVGLLGDEALGVVEIVPDSGVYDYTSKYTRGKTEYRYPAELDEATSLRVRDYALAAYRACDCRDFARADFILDASGVAWFLELNTIPGMTETSLLPKSASCLGISYTELVRRTVMPALARAHYNLPSSQ